jgi:YidC/Oxa1 family membrane protein insertase
MDDQGKRLILALVISLVFLFVYQRYFLPPAPIAVEEATEQKAPAPAEEISSIPEVGDVPSEPLKPIAATDEKTINISTPLYRARLTNKSGALSSFKLSRYRQDIKDDETHVEMVRAVGEEGLLPLTAEFIAAGPVPG